MIECKNGNVKFVGNGYQLLHEVGIVVGHLVKMGGNEPVFQQATEKAIIASMIVGAVDDYLPEDHDANFVADDEEFNALVDEIWKAVQVPKKYFIDKYGKKK